MKYETTGDLHLPKIGFGTWNIGGSSTADPSEDGDSLAALRSALELGYTLFDTAEMYAAGHTEELLGQAIWESGLRREDLFITSKVKPEHLHYSDVLKSCEGTLRRLRLQYLDLYLIHWPNPNVALGEAFEALNELVAEGRVRRLGVSNFNVEQLKEARLLASTPILTNQVPYSLGDRSYVANGVLEFCQKNNILLTAYSPLDQGDLRVSSRLSAIAQNHAATTFQIALAWLVAQPLVITIPMSKHREHQRQNLKAAEFMLSEQEIRQLD